MRMLLEVSATPTVPRAALSALMVMVAAPGIERDTSEKEKAAMKVGFLKLYWRRGGRGCV